MIKVSVIIVNWNTESQLYALIKQLSNAPTIEIIVIDNASTQVPDLPADILLIKNRRNRGYAFACNQGVIHAQGEWCVFLNPDICISQTTLLQMLAEAESRNLTACSPYSSTSGYDKPLPSSLSLLAEFTPFKYILNLRWFKQKSLFGGCLLINTTLIKDLGGWDERFFLWFEDADLTQRLLNHHYRIGWLSQPVDHIGGASFQTLHTQTRRQIFFHSLSVYARKHFTPIGKLLVALIKYRYARTQLLPATDASVTLVVPNLRLQLLHEFMDQNKHAFSHIAELVIVSSAVRPETVWEWRKKYPEVRFICIDKNYGFANTVNIGLRVATSAWVGTVNDDVIMNNSWTENCIQAATKNTGSINPIIYKQDHTVESAGIKVLPYGKALPISTYSQTQSVMETDATNAAAVLYSHSALNTVGLYDERFGSYLEDIDLSLRLKRAGYTNVVVTNSQVVHAGQSTSRALRVHKNWLDFKNWILAIIKNWSFKELALNIFPIVLERARNLYGIIKAL